eukprot:gene68233-93491_t
MTGIGLLVSVIANTQQQAFLGMFALTVPVFLLSGYAAPIDNVPPFMQLLAEANPAKHFLIVTEGLFLKGMPALADAGHRDRDDRRRVLPVPFAPGVTSMRRLILAALPLTLFASACTVGPDYHRPASPGETGGWLSSANPASIDPAPWATLGDPVLSDLIARAMTANLDIAEAEGRLREARAQRGVAR